MPGSNLCFKVISLPELNWYDAKEACTSEIANGRLAVFDTHRKIDFLVATAILGKLYDQYRYVLFEFDKILFFLCNVLQIYLLPMIDRRSFVHIQNVTLVDLTSHYDLTVITSAFKRTHALNIQLQRRLHFIFPKR